MRKLPGPTNITKYRRLTHDLKAFLKEDQKQQAATAGALAGAKVNPCKIREAWSIIRRWFAKAEDQPLPPS